MARCSECPRPPEAIIDSSMMGECKMKRAVMYFSQAPTDKSFTALQMEFSSLPPSFFFFLDGAHVFRLELALRLAIHLRSLNPGTALSPNLMNTLVITADIEWNLMYCAAQ